MVPKAMISEQPFLRQYRRLIARCQIECWRVVAVRPSLPVPGLLRRGAKLQLATGMDIACTRLAGMCRTEDHQRRRGRRCKPTWCRGPRLAGSLALRASDRGVKRPLRRNKGEVSATWLIFPSIRRTGG